MGNRRSHIVKPIAKILPSSHMPSSLSTTTNTTPSTRTRPKLARAKTVAFKRPKDQSEHQADPFCLDRARVGSMFYSDNSNHIDVTTPLVKDQEVVPLNMENQNTVELIETMKGELRSLSDMIMPISTGTAAINLTVRDKEKKGDGACV